MTRTLAEVLLLIFTTLCAGYVMFVATVLQPVMNELDEAAFGRFVPSLYRHATRSVYAVGSSTLPFVAMIPYFIVYRLEHPWFVAGLACFTLASIMSKIMNLPVYGRIAALRSDEVAKLGEERRKLQTANNVRAVISLASVILMAIQFGC